MNQELLIARLMAMRAMIDVWLIEATEAHLIPKCCAAPVIKVEETYGGILRSYCGNCGTEFSKAGSDKVSGDDVGTTN